MSNLISVKDYADQLGVSTSTVYAKIKSGKVKSVVRNNKKHIVIDNDSGAVVEYNHPEIEFVDIDTTIDEREIELLHKRIKELEEHTKLFDAVVEENMALRKENRKLLKALPNKNDNKKGKQTKQAKHKKEKLEVIEIELVKYLISLGFTERERYRVVRKFKKSRGEDRVIEKDGKFYLNLKKYSYDELIYG